MAQEWIKTISSNAFGGRKPMTFYEEATVGYLVQQLGWLGLEPGFGDSWTQPFRMAAVTCWPVGGKITVKGRRKANLNYPDDLIVWTARTSEKVERFPTTEYVFCGFGVNAPEYGWNDYAGVDVRGKIYNGAADNASGIAGVLLAARKFRAMPQTPRRSILFLFPFSEESGLFGSQYYCDHPAFPMDNTVACLNYERIGPAPLTRDVVILGGGESALDGYFVAATATQGRTIFFDDDNFVKKGVPAVVVENGLHPVDTTREDKYPMFYWYHQPRDEYRDDWDLSGTMANIYMLFSVGLSLSNTAERP